MIYQAIALGLSITVHLALVNAVGASNGPNSKVRPVKTEAVRYMSASHVKREQEKFFPLPLNQKLNQAEPIASPLVLENNISIHSESDPLPSASEPLLTVARKSETHYFRTKEVTEKPLVIQDHVSNLSLYLPGVPSQIAEMRLFINEYGDVDRVKIERSALPEEVENLIIEALSKTKFKAGKIDQTAVKTQLKIEIAIESAAPQTDYLENGKSVSSKSDTFEMEYVSE